MTLQDIYTILQTLNLPVTYMAFKSTQNPPYIVYYESGAGFRGSDEKNYIKDMNVTIELYCENKNTQIEKQIEDLFSDVELSKSEDIWIDDEQLIMVTYEFTTINKE